MKSTVKIIATVIVSGTMLWFSLWLLGNLSLGYLFPRAITDSLTNPKKVFQIRESGLLLEGGGVTPIPWIARVPADLPILNDAIAQGVEIDSEGRVFGLIRIHHCCGNDPVKKHLARVNLSNLLLAWGVENTAPKDLLPSLREQQYTKHGWSISNYSGAGYLVAMIEMESAAALTDTKNAPSSSSAP